MRALLLALVAACAPVPEFHGLGSPAIDAADGREGPLTVHVTSHDGFGLPLDASRVAVSKPGGGFDQTTTDASGDAQIRITGGQSVFVEDVTGGIPRLTVVLGAQPDETLRVGGPVTMAESSGFTVDVVTRIPAQSGPSTLLGYTPCGTIAKNFSNNTTDLAVAISMAIDTRCATLQYDAMVLRRTNDATRALKYATLLRVGPMVDSEVYDASTNPDIQVAQGVQFTNDDSGIASFGGALWALAEHRHLADFPLSGQISPTTTPTVAFAIGTEQAYTAEFLLTRTAGGQQLVAHRYNWSGPGVASIDVAQSSLAPWIADPPTVLADGALDWVEDGTGRAIFATATVLYTNDGAPTLVRILAPANAIDNSAYPKMRIALPPLPPGFEPYAFPAGNVTAAAIREYAFAPGVEWDQVRAEADLHAAPWNDYVTATSLTSVAIGGAQLSTPE